ncbi:unnamed protein product [Haemonchus placei]|uniref:CCHC-type domain-containing protein n=1 Tax=Haemonchus placei TaxID=6290 RepID=A0A0N4W7H8_HAEPC|nr:unnamed protein product [Haemonchus placei]
MADEDMEHSENSSQSGEEQPAVNACNEESLTNSIELIKKTVAKLTSELELLRQDAYEKEAIAKKAKDNIIFVENQLQSSLTFTPPVATVQPSLQTNRGQPSEQQGTPLMRRGRCKFLCGSNTHVFATECDVYVTVSARRNRMHELNI